MRRMRAEARKSRIALSGLLAQQRETLRGSDLWPIACDAVGLCSGTFEKAYLAKLIGRMCGAPERACELAGIAAELFMFAALTADDWTDGTPFRNGKPAIHVAYGSGKAVLAANCLTEVAHLALVEAADCVPVGLRSAFLSSFSTAALSIQAGQARVLELAGTRIDSETVLERLARQRCGLLIASAMGGGAYLAGRTELVPGLTKAGMWVGVALQHRNDIQDFTVAFDQTIKPPLADLLNGQPNLVVCLLLQSVRRMKPKERALLVAMHGRNSSGRAESLTRDEFSRILTLVDKYGAARRACGLLTARVAQVKRAISEWPPSAEIQELADYLDLLVQP